MNYDYKRIPQTQANEKVNGLQNGVTNAGQS
jgi:hypothetical protein